MSSTVEIGSAVTSDLATGPRRIVLALSGSLRRGSYNSGLLAAAAELAPRGVTVEVERNLAEIPMFVEDLEQSPDGDPASVRGLRRRLATADGLLIATPEYNHSFPGVLKNAIDWLSRPAPDELLAGKPVAVLGASAGAWGTRLAQAALRQVLFATEALVLPSPTLFVRDAGLRFDDQGRLTDAAIRERLGAFVRAFSDWMDRVVPRPRHEGAARSRS